MMIAMMMDNLAKSPSNNSRNNHHLNLAESISIVSGGILLIMLIAIALGYLYGWWHGNDSQERIKKKRKGLMTYEILMGINVIFVFVATMCQTKYDIGKGRNWLYAGCVFLGASVFTSGLGVAILIRVHGRILCLGCGNYIKILNLGFTSGLFISSILDIEHEPTPDRFFFPLIIAISDCISKLIDRDQLERRIYELETNIRDNSGSGSIELIEAPESIQELNAEKERLARLLKTSEDENAHLISENLVTKQKLEEIRKMCTLLDDKLKLSEEDLHNTNSLFTQALSTNSELKHKISLIMEEKNLLNESHQKLEKELQAVISEYEEKLKIQKEQEDSLISEIENLWAEAAEKSVLQNLLKEAEEEFKKAEFSLQEEVGSILAVASQREAELNSKLENYTQKIHDRDLLNEMVMQLQEELQLAQATIANQKETGSHKDLERETALKSSLEELEFKNKEISSLQKQMVELEQKLELAGVKVSDKN